MTSTGCTITIERDGAEITESDLIYAGDILTITATADEGKELKLLTVNGEEFVSGGTLSVTGNVTIVGTGTLKTFDLGRTATNCTITVTKGGVSVSDGEDVLTYGDEITITATTEGGYEMSSLTVNGETFTSGEDYTVIGDTTIVGIAE